jgi:hypothetical protein
MFLSFFVYKKEEKCCITEDYHYLCTRKSELYNKKQSKLCI